MRLLACVVVVFATLSIQVIAAEVPNVIGTWMIVSKKLSTDGTAARAPGRSHVAQHQDRLTGWPMFSGTIAGPKRKTERIVGHFAATATFVYSSDQTAGAGQVQGNEMRTAGRRGMRPSHPN